MKSAKYLLALGLAASAGVNAETSIRIDGTITQFNGFLPALGAKGPVVEFVTTDDTTGTVPVGAFIDPGYRNPDTIGDKNPYWYQPGDPYPPTSTIQPGVQTSDLYIGDKDCDGAGSCPTAPPNTQHWIPIEPGNVQVSTMRMNNINTAVVGGSLQTLALLNGSFPITMVWNFDNMTFTLQFDNETPGNPPSTGVITSVRVVPIPASAWLFGSALLGLIGAARNRKIKS